MDSLGLLVFLFLVAASSMVAESDHQCAFFDYLDCKNHNDPNCTGNRTCRTTGGIKEYCYALWSNKSGEIIFKKRGCWANKRCAEHASCVGEIHAKTGLIFCCCANDYCNRNISAPPYMTADQISTTPVLPPALLPTKKAAPKLPKVLLYYVLVPIFGLIVMLAVLFYMWKRHKRSLIGRRIPLVDYSPPPSPPLGSHPIQLIDIVAQGQFGCVYKAKSLHEVVAVKVFSQQDRASWITEKEIYTKYDMRHDSILKYIGAEKRGQIIQMQYWIITEYHEHGSLADYLKNNVLSWEELLRMVLGIIGGLVYLHSDIPDSMPPKPAIAHRDFKSRNILVKSDLNCCIGDFGLAVAFENILNQGEARAQVGTKRYMAPEVLEGAITFQRESFLRIDVYALALVLWELVSRCNVFDDDLGEYKMPFEDQVGTHPSIEDMQETVVEKKFRPKFEEQWKRHAEISLICETMEDCWDQDADARLTAHCAHERLLFLQHPRKSMSDLTTCIKSSSGDDIKTSSGVSSCSLSEGRESTF